MKTYNQFLNEDTNYLNIPIYKDFEFVIDIKNATEEKINKAFNEFEKYTKLEDWLKKYLVSKDGGGKTWAWRIKLRKGYFDNKSAIELGIITTANWGLNQGMKVMDNRLTIDEFIKVGLLGAEDYINSGISYFKVLDRIKKREEDVKKYNL